MRSWYAFIDSPYCRHKRQHLSILEQVCLRHEEKVCLSRHQGFSDNSKHPFDRFHQ